MSRIKARLKLGFRKYIVDALSHMAFGLFCSLILGLIIGQIAKIPGLDFLKFIADALSASSPLVGACIGLAIANGIVALAGALLAQYKGSANINDGRGAIVIALAAIFIGLSVSLKIKPNFVVSLIGVVGGGIVYYIIYTFVILLGLKTDYLKMLSAIIVALFLAVPYLKGEYFQKKKVMPLPASPEPDHLGGGDTNA